MHFIHQIFAAQPGERWDNQRMLAAFEPMIECLPLSPGDLMALKQFVRFQLVGKRSRYVIKDWRTFQGFAIRAAAFEEGAAKALDLLAAQIAPAAEVAGIVFDAIISTTATGNLMPGLSYRLAKRLGGLVRRESLLLDLGNAGCAGSMKALRLASSMNGSPRQILIVAFEAPSTLVNVESTEARVWQGNCTFGDGAATLWISTERDQGPAALALEEIRSWQWAEAALDLIHWDYKDYYGFALRDEKTFDTDVSDFVAEALKEMAKTWDEESRWVIHPAGVVLLARIARRFGIPADAIGPSVDHYRTYSNMSSVSILQVLKEVMENTPEGRSVNLLSMGAGFDVLYGRVRRVR
jgi:alkylresorcinol/alkylpyrone synthase